MELLVLLVAAILVTLLGGWGLVGYALLGLAGVAALLVAADGFDWRPLMFFGGLAAFLTLGALWVMHTPRR